MTKVIAFSAKKSGGKDTAANFILGTIIKKHGLASDFKITPQGKLYVYGWVNGAAEDGVFDYDANTQFVSSVKKNYLDKHIKLYSFADCLKKEVCIKLLGLTYEQCYGTDEQKNSLTHLRWEDMPGVTTILFWSTIEGLKFHTAGFMTAREVMQFCGTEIFRRMYGDCHVNATFKQIEQDGPEIAIIRDTRFPNEVEGSTSRGGYVVRLLRDPNAGKDQHESETALDDYPSEKFYAVIDNREMSIPDQNETVRDILNSIYKD